MSELHRIDIWLKHVCLFKHRGDATEACRGGHVKLNGNRVKPAANVKVGDVVEFYLADRFRRVVVSAVPETQPSKEAARAMYVDESPQQEKVDAVTAILRDRGMGRPTKKERRDIEKLRS